MKEILITSSVLIAVLLLLRRVLRGKISLRLQYALWLLVAVRLLLPLSLFSSPVSVMNAVRAAEARRPASLVADLEGPAQSAGFPAPQSSSPHGADQAAGQREGTAPVPVTAAETKGPTLDEVFRTIWLSGAAVMGVWLLFANLTFRRRLRDTVMGLEVPGCPVPVCVSPAAPSPCLTGLFRQRIYLTPGVEGDEIRLRHVLTHELTHRRHGDPLWSLLRCLCLVLYWFDPLVWVAAAVSRRDCELACDEGALAQLGEGERTAYGRTLLSLAAQRVSPADLLRPATTMSAGKGGLRERITLIAKRPRMVAATLAAVIAAAALAVGCTFTSAQPAEPAQLPPAASGLEQALSDLPEELREQIVVEGPGNQSGDASDALASYSYAPDYGTQWGGWLCNVERISPVQFEQQYESREMTGGVRYLGRDASWYYMCEQPTDVNFDPAHEAEYRSAAGSLTAWLENLFAAREGILPIEEDPVYRAFQADCTFPGRHVNVLCYPYHGLEGYEAETVTYTLLLSQPVRQGAGGIWCMDRWYDSDGNCHIAVPRESYLGEPQATMEEYYSDLQAQCDEGRRDDLLDPAGAARFFLEILTGRKLSPGAFQAGEIYVGSPQFGPPVLGTNQAVMKHMGELAAINGQVTLTLETGGARRSFSVPLQWRSGPSYSNLTSNHDWTEITAEAAGALLPDSPAYTVTVSGLEAWQGSFEFRPDCEAVLWRDSTGETWYRARRLREDPCTLTETMRRWFDEAELYANLERYAVVTTDSRDIEEVALLWAEGLGEAMRHLSPGSEYEVRDARPYRIEIHHETVPTSFQQVVFELEMALDPVDPTGPGFAAGAGLTPIEEGACAGYWSWYHEVRLTRTYGENVWRLDQWGTGGLV